MNWEADQAMAVLGIAEEEHEAVAGIIFKKQVSHHSSCVIMGHLFFLCGVDPHHHQKRTLKVA